MGHAVRCIALSDDETKSNAIGLDAKPLKWLRYCVSGLIVLQRDSIALWNFVRGAAWRRPPEGAGASFATINAET